MTGDPELLRLASIKTLVNRKSRRRSDATRQSTHLHRKNLSTHYPAPDRDAVSLGASWFGGRPSAPSVSTRDTGSKTEGSIAASETSGDATASEVDFDTVSTSTGTSLYRLHQQQAEAVRLTSFCCAHRGSGEELLAASLSTSSLLVLRRSPPPDAALPPPPPQQQQPAQARRWLVAMPQIFDGAAIEALAASPDHQCILVLSSNAALHLLAIAELEQEVGADAAAAASTRSIAPPGARHGAPRGGAAVLGPSLAQMTRSARGSTATHSSISAGIEEVFAEPVTVKQLPQDRRAQQGRGAAKQSPAQQQRLCCVWWQTDGGAHIAVVSAAAAGASRVHFVDMATSNRFTLQLQGASAVTALRIVRLEAAAQRLIFLLATCADGAAHSVLLEMGLPLPPPPPLEEAAAAAAEEAQEGQAAAAAVEADDSGLQVQPPLAEGGQAEAAAAPAAAAPPPPPPYWQLTQHTSGNTRAAPVRIDTLAGASALFILDAVSSSGSGDGGAEGGGELRLAAVSRNGAQLQIFAASADALYQCHRDKRRSAMSAVMLLTVAIPVLLHGAAPPAALLLSSAAAAAAAAEAAAPRPRRCVCAALYALPGALLLLECAAALPTVAAAAADAEAPWRAPPAATALTKAVFKLSRGEALVWAEACSGSSSGASGGGAALSSEESEALGFSVCTTQSVYMLSLGRAGGGDATAGAASPPPRTGKVSRSPPMRVPHGAHKEGREAGQLLAQARRLHEAGKRYQAVELLAGALGLDTDPSNPSCGPGGEVKLQAKAVRLSPLKGEIGAIGGSVTGKMTLESMADTLLGWLVELEVEVGSGGGSGGGGGRDTTQQQQQQPLPKPPPPPPLLLHNLLTSDAPYDLQAAAALMLDRGLVSAALTAALARSSSSSSSSSGTSSSNANGGSGGGGASGGGSGNGGSSAAVLRYVLRRVFECTDGALRLSAADAAAVTAAGHGSALFATGGADCLAALPVALQLRILLSDGTLRSGAAAADVAGGAARCDAHLRLLSLLPRLSQAQCVIVCATVARRLELQQQQQRQQTALPNGSQTLLPAVEVVIAALLHCAHAAAAAAAAAAEGAAANEGIAELRQLLCLGEPCLVAVSAPAAAAQSAEPSSFSTYAGQTNQVLRKHCLIPVPHGEGSSGFDNGSGDGGASISSAAAASASSGGGIDSATVKCAAAAQRAALELVRDLGLGFRAGLDVCRLLLLAVDLGNWAAAAGLLAAAGRHAEAALMQLRGAAYFLSPDATVACVQSILRGTAGQCSSTQLAINRGSSALQEGSTAQQQAADPSGAAQADYHSAAQQEASSSSSSNSSAQPSAGRDAVAACRHVVRCLRGYAERASATVEDWKPLAAALCLWHHFNLPAQELQHLQQLSEELMDSRHHGTQITAALASLLFSAMARATQHSSSGACAFTSSQMACAQALPFAPQFLLQLLRRTRGGGHMGSSAALPPTSSADTTSLASVQMAGSAAPQLQPLLRPAQIDISPSRGERVTGEGWVAFLCGHRFSNAELRDIVLPATEKELQSSAQQWPVVAAVWRKQYTRGDGLSPAACPRCTLRVVQSMRVRSSDGGLPGRGGADLYSAAT